MRNINVSNNSKFLTNKILFAGIGVWDIVIISLYSFVLTRILSHYDVSIDSIQIILVATIPLIYGFMVYKEKNLPQRWLYFKILKTIKPVKKISLRSLK